MASRSKRVFQLITLILVVAVFQVYVMGAPLKVVTDSPKGDTPKTSEAKAESVTPDSSTTAVSLTVKAAAEKLPLTPGSKINFNRIFSKSEIQARSASSHTFLNAKVNGRDTFKAPPRVGSSAAAADNDDDSGAKKGVWIAVGVIAVVLTIAVIGLRHDRNR